MRRRRCRSSCTGSLRGLHLPIVPEDTSASQRCSRLHLRMEDDEEMPGAARKDEEIPGVAGKEEEMSVVAGKEEEMPKTAGVEEERRKLIRPALSPVFGGGRIGCGPPHPSAPPVHRRRRRRRSLLLHTNRAATDGTHRCTRRSVGGRMATPATTAMCPSRTGGT
ncbi:uncharacterized protein LOC124690931 [Lolium rigidum]|uniref:uncharacterized protein LOC124690931 n=1 Tax=Lolium rigidum TaxID=89674 RepID=UPI001F5C4B67|nr:uncharacterized protein LOC124690931 [Lolium rigidum]